MLAGIFFKLGLQVMEFSLPSVPVSSAGCSGWRAIFSRIEAIMWGRVRSGAAVVRHRHLRRQGGHRGHGELGLSHLKTSNTHKVISQKLRLTKFSFQYFVNLLTRQNWKIISVYTKELQTSESI